MLFSIFPYIILDSSFDAWAVKNMSFCGYLLLSLWLWGQYFLEDWWGISLHTNLNRHLVCDYKSPKAHLNLVCNTGSLIMYISVPIFLSGYQRASTSCSHLVYSSHICTLSSAFNNDIFIAWLLPPSL